MSLEIHFLNVGHGDCTFLDLPGGRLSMVDINNSKTLPESDQLALAWRHGVAPQTFRGAGIAAGERSLEARYRSLLVDPADYYHEHFAGRSVFRYVQTHPDMDHMSGIDNFFLEHEIPLQNFWDIAHEKEIEEGDFDGSAYQYLDWLAYRLLRQGAGPNDSTHTVLRLARGDEGQYWTNDEITVLSPDAGLLAVCNALQTWNDCSYVLKVSYANRSAILAGDAEERAWEAILEEVGPESLKCDILKAAHHGRESGFHQEAVEAMAPSIVICSVGKKPDTDASDEYEALGARVFSTRFHGAITVKIWFDGEVWVSDHEGNQIASLPPH